MKYKIEKKTCKKCKDSFIIEPNDFSFYQKMQVPSPEICPDCRFKMRAMFRNETTLYSGRKCDMCGKGIISMYNPKSPYTIYCYDCFYSEKWDPRDYAIDYDPNKSIVEQYKELLLKVPKITTDISVAEGVSINSEYSNMAGGLRNCYLVFNTGPAEDLLYSRGMRYAKDSSDLYFGTNVERCYECINVQDSNGIMWGQNITGSIDSSFVFNCRGLINCFGCVNLNNKSYYFLNKPVTKEEYNKKVKEVMGSYKSIESFKKEFQKLILSFPMRVNNNIKSVNSSGEYIFESKNIRNSFEITKSEDSSYLFSVKEIKDSRDIIGYGFKSEKLLETVASGHSNNVIASYGVENSSDILYGFFIHNCKNCIACDALHNVEYSILNKKYSKEEYEILKTKIITELKNSGLYGIMMPLSIAPFAYNESIAQDNMPLTKEEALRQGFRWEEDIQKTEGRETIESKDLPDHIRDISDSIINEILCCVDCSRNYNITNQELLFYKKMIIPLPRKCFYCRHKDRINRRGPIKFWDRKCDKCNKDMKTNFSPEQPGIVYCESCYQKEVY